MPTTARLQTSPTGRNETLESCRSDAIMLPASYYKATPSAPSRNEGVSSPPGYDDDLAGGSGSGSDGNTIRKDVLPPTESPRSSVPLYANFDVGHVTLAAGVAIFHIASARVVLCYHTRDKYWFLPKGRKDAGETIEQAAAREGFEESGYRNCLLPLPLPHRQPLSSSASSMSPQFTCEPIWTQLAPNSRSTQYILFWYIAETAPLPLVAEPCSNKAEADAPQDSSNILHGAVSTVIEDSRGTPSVASTPLAASVAIRDRMGMEPEGYEPVRHEGTGVDEEEALYWSELVDVNTAIRRLGRSIMADVVRKGWEAIQLRDRLENPGQP